MSVGIMAGAPPLPSWRSVPRPGSGVEKSPGNVRAKNWTYVDAGGSRCTNSNACFKWSGSEGPRIYLERTGSIPDYFWDTITHEYGHFVHYTYGQPNGNCIHEYDESSPVSEAVADFVSHLVIREHGWQWPTGYSQNYTYRNWFSADYLPRIKDRGQYVEGGSTAGCWYLAYTGTDDCKHSTTQNWCISNPVPSDDHFVRRYKTNPLRAALWQIMHDVDCQATGTNCSDNSYNNVHSRNDIGFSDKAHATQMTAAAMANALNSTGSVLVPSDIAYWMYYWWITHGYPTQGSNALDVFEFHEVDW